MPIFECSKCHCVENTAVSRYWFREKGSPALCSECDPEIKEWHCCFEKKSAVGYLLGNDGFLYHKDEDLEWRKKHQGFKIVREIKK